MIIVYGRRRVGKIVFVKKLVEDIFYIYFFVEEIFESENFRMFKSLVVKVFGNFLVEKVEFLWEEFFEFFDGFGVVVIIDEFLNFLKVNRGLVLKF